MPAQAGLKALTTSAAQLGVRATTPKPATLKMPEIGKVTRLASSIDQVTITPVRIDAPKPAVSAYQGSAAGEVMTPAKSFTPKAQADYSRLGIEQKKAMTQTFPKAIPDRADAVAPKPQQATGPTPPSAPNSQALQAMRTSVPPDATSVPGNPEATVSKLKPLRDQLSLQVGRLSPGQGSALIGAGMRTAAAQAAVVRDEMNATQDQLAASRKRLNAMRERQQEHSVRIAERLKVKFDSIPQHLQDFAARAAKEITVPAGLEETPLEKMLSGEGVVGFKGPGIAAYEQFMADQ